MSVSSGDVRMRERDILKVALVSLAGSTIEWYDFFIYGTAAALVFPQLFFPGSSPLIGTLAAFSTFAVGFIARPIGGLIWGHFGDRAGRKKALVAALLIMGTATTLVGFLPTYATIGVAAPILLFVLRFVQGLAVGGQWGGAVLIATEHAPRDKRGFYGSFAQMGVPLAVIISNALFLVLAAVFAPEQFAAWAWRIPFLLSVLLIGVALYAQLRLEDTPAFRHLQEAQEEPSGDLQQDRSRSPIIDVFRSHPKQILLAAGSFIAVNGGFYIYIVYTLSYGTEVLGVSKSVMLTAVLISSAISLLLIPGFSRLSDSVGRRPVYLGGAILTVLVAFPVFWLIDTKSAFLIFLGLLLGNIGNSAMYGPQAAFFSEIFDTKVRYSGASMGYQIGAVFGGGFAPLICASLYAATKTSASISGYLLVMALVTLVSAYLLSETYQTDVDDAQEPTDARGTRAGERGAALD